MKKKALGDEKTNRIYIPISHLSISFIFLYLNLISLDGSSAVLILNSNSNLA
jgi:hypothetical protein